MEDQNNTLLGISDYRGFFGRIRGGKREYLGFNRLRLDFVNQCFTSSEFDMMIIHFSKVTETDRSIDLRYLGQYKHMAICEDCTNAIQSRMAVLITEKPSPNWSLLSTGEDDDEIAVIYSLDVNRSTGAHDPYAVIKEVHEWRNKEELDFS